MGLTRRHIGPVVVLILALFVGACAKKIPGIPVTGEVKSGQFINTLGLPADDPEIVRLARNADYILVGEEHTNACDHHVQKQVVALLGETGRNLAVGLEMVPANLQPVLDRFNSGDIPAEDLDEELDWENIWGHNYEYYLPIFQAARKRNIPLVGLNVSRNATAVIREQGLEDLAEEFQRELPEQIIEPSPEQRDVLKDEFKRHQDLGIENILERFLLIQSVWDTKIANEAVKYRARTGKTMVILAGSGHVEYGWGIKHRLNSLAPLAEVVLIMPWRGGHSLQAEAADLFYYCPAKHRSRLGFELSMEEAGALVTGVVPESKAEKAGVIEGDIIVKAGGQELQSLMTLHEVALTASKDNVPLTLEVLREGERVMLTIDLDQVKEAR